MAVPDEVSLADVKNHLSEVVDRVERQHGRVVITKHGRPAAVILSLEDLRSLEETLSILSDRRLMKDLAEAEHEVETGRTKPLTKEEALAAVRRR
jgi:antitoxin YefM